MARAACISACQGPDVGEQLAVLGMAQGQVSVETVPLDARIATLKAWVASA